MQQRVAHLRSRRGLAFIVLTFASVVGVSGCAFKPEPPVEYSAFCPTWLINTAKVARDDDDSWSEREVNVKFDDCGAELLPIILIRGTKIPESIPDVGAYLPGTKVYIKYNSTEGDPVSITSEKTGLSRRSWESGWRAAVVMDSGFAGESIGTGEYKVFLTGHDRGGDDYGQVKIEFMYDCNCDCNHGYTTTDFDGLNLRFDGSPAVKIEPARPMRLSPFDIVWTTCYDLWGCMDDPYRPMLEVEYIIKNEYGEVVDKGFKEVGNVRMGDCNEFRITHPGLPVDSTGEAFEVSVKLNPFRILCECESSSGWPEGLDSPYADNAAAAQFFVEWCDCPVNGDLVVDPVLAMTDWVIHGRPLELIWYVCYEPICSLSAEDTAPFGERVTLRGADGSFVADLSHAARLEGLSLSECHKRSVTTPADLEPGEYIIRIEADPGDEVFECDHADPANNSWEWSFTVLPDIGEVLEVEVD